MPASPVSPLPYAHPLETRRLMLQPLVLADVPVVQHLFPHWETVRFMSTRVPWPYPDDGALVFVRDHALPAMERREEWHWSIRLRQAREDLIGLVSLVAPRDECLDHRGFWLAPPYRGQGLMMEACQVVTEFWFTDLGFPLLRTTKAAQNAPSIQISRNQGMRRVGTGEADYVGGRLVQEIWEITREEWQRDRRIDQGLQTHERHGRGGVEIL